MRSARGPESLPRATDARGPPSFVARPSWAGCAARANNHTNARRSRACFPAEKQNRRRTSRSAAVLQPALLVRRIRRLTALVGFIGLTRTHLLQLGSRLGAGEIAHHVLGDGGRRSAGRIGCLVLERPDVGD